MQRVVLATAVQLVVAVAAEQLVVAGLALEFVVAAAAVQVVVAVAPSSLSLLCPLDYRRWTALGLMVVDSGLLDPEGSEKVGPSRR